MSNTSKGTKAELQDQIQVLKEHVSLLESTASERLHATEQLRDSERKNIAWLEYSPVCTKIVSLDLNLNYMSAAGVEALMIDDIRPYYGKPYPFEFYPQSFRDEMTENLNKVKITGKINTQEAAVVDIEGNEVWFHSTLVPVNDENGQMDYIIVVSIDVTERKQVENELRQLNAKLEMRVENRTQELKKANLRLKVLSETDPLTKLANRRAYTQRLGKEVADAKRTKHPLSLLMIDIDHFKQYNDNYGHDNGDIALKQVAKTIQSTLPRATDLAVRFGGEEFLVLLPYTHAEGALEVAEKIRSNIQLVDIKHSYSDTASVLTVSIGVSTHDYRTINENKILRQADDALYKSKINGRNQIQCFEHSD